MCESKSNVFHWNLVYIRQILLSCHRLCLSVDCVSIRKYLVRVLRTYNVTSFHFKDLWRFQLGFLRSRFFPFFLKIGFYIPKENDNKNNTKNNLEIIQATRSLTMSLSYQVHWLFTDTQNICLKLMNHCLCHPLRVIIG